MEKHPNDRQSGVKGAALPCGAWGSAPQKEVTKRGYKKRLQKEVTKEITKEVTKEITKEITKRVDVFSVCFAFFRLGMPRRGADGGASERG